MFAGVLKASKIFLLIWESRLYQEYNAKRLFHHAFKNSRHRTSVVKFMLYFCQGSRKGILSRKTCNWQVTQIFCQTDSVLQYFLLQVAGRSHFEESKCCVGN